MRIRRNSHCRVRLRGREPECPPLCELQTVPGQRGAGAKGAPGSRAAPRLSRPSLRGGALCLFPECKFGKRGRKQHENHEKSRRAGPGAGPYPEPRRLRRAAELRRTLDGASYTEDTELGEGAKTLSVEVTAEDKTITFTIHTDAENLRGALEENGLVSGDESEYGLYVKSVNGIAADYDADGYYWALSKAGEYLMTGVDDTLIADGEQYELVRTAA